MDSRIQKTKKSIFDAFVELRSQKELERITVKELTDTAKISKQTFYLHYRDIYDLADKVENELIEEMCQILPDVDDILDNIGYVAITLFKRATAQDTIFKTIFSGSRMSSLPHGIVRELKKAVYSQHPELRADLHTNIYLSYLVHGAYNAYQEYKTIDQDNVIKILGDIANCMSEGYNYKFKR
ncbi:MAG: TetR/AcrR family transcriptional regulator [Lachnospiraceae bacterium]|nr:TetR/AcrR family transcriptional regulator [Lachnospiraceae bacterium]